MNTITTFTTATSRQQASDAIARHYDEAREVLSKTGGFGKELDRKSRKLALRMASLKVPEGACIAWATADGWGSGLLGYRGQKAADMQA